MKDFHFLLSLILLLKFLFLIGVGVLHNMFLLCFTVFD